MHLIVLTFSTRFFLEKIYKAFLRNAARITLRSHTLKRVLHSLCLIPLLSRFPLSRCRSCESKMPQFRLHSTIEVAQRNKYTSTRSFVSLHRLMARMLPIAEDATIRLVAHFSSASTSFVDVLTKPPRNETTFASFSYFVLEARRESNYTLEECV